MLMNSCSNNPVLQQLYLQRSISGSRKYGGRGRRNKSTHQSAHGQVRMRTIETLQTSVTHVLSLPSIPTHFPEGASPLARSSEAGRCLRGALRLSHQRRPPGPGAPEPEPAAAADTTRNLWQTSIFPEPSKAKTQNMLPKLLAVRELLTLSWSACLLQAIEWALKLESATHFPHP
mmetsp:Transcript_87018/g.172750  ORF Transcript_87018/g.172750 Transcript_87018/m.172750 type:complete len:175 (-) Transcript_87018:126-650(-)